MPAYRRRKVALFRYSILVCIIVSARRGDLFRCRRFQNWFRALKRLCWLCLMFQATLSGVLSQPIMFKTNLLCGSSSARYHADRNSSIYFLSFILIFKTAKDKMPTNVADFALTYDKAFLFFSPRKKGRKIGTPDHRLTLLSLQC